MPIVGAGLALASAPVLILAGTYDSAGQTALALGLGTAALAALALLPGRAAPAPLAPGGSAVLGLVLPGLWIGAMLFATLDWWYLPLLALAPALLAVRALPPLRSARPWVRTLGGIAAVALPAIVAVALAFALNISEYDELY